MITLKSPAKINWSLYVLNRRYDGYHNIISLMQCIDLYDSLIFENSDKIELFSNIKINADENIILKAVKVLQEYTCIKSGVKITLEKKIPIGAGLGGGSSNAAYTLMGLNQLWDLKLNNSELIKLSTMIGSDVPFFFHCPMAIVEGKGDILTPLHIKKSYILLLVKPFISISTAWAYREISSKGFVYKDIELTKTVDNINNIKLIYNALKTGDIATMKSLIKNDFESVVTKKYPIISDIKIKMMQAGAAFALMSGSGSTVFGLFDNKEKALSASKIFSSYWNSVVLTIAE